jgi:hypothetical protein
MGIDSKFGAMQLNGGASGDAFSTLMSSVEIL